MIQLSTSQLTTLVGSLFALGATGLFFYRWVLRRPQDIWPGEEDDEIMDAPSSQSEESDIEDTDGRAAAFARSRR